MKHSIQQEAAEAHFHERKVIDGISRLVRPGAVL